MLPKALKSCPKSNKSPNMVTLLRRQTEGEKNRMKERQNYEATFRSKERERKSRLI